MKRLRLALLLAAGCSSVPGPKAPDESHRVPVNRVVPSEATPDGGAEKPIARKGHRNGREVEWR